MSKHSQQEIATLATRPQTKNTKYFTSQKMTYLATMTVITLFLKTIGGVFSIGDSLRISFVYSAWIIAGITLGAIGGGIAGGISDILCSLIYGWAINPLMTLSNILFPCIIGLCYKFIPIKSASIKMIIGTTIASISCTLFLSTIALYVFYGMTTGFWAYLLSVRLIQLVVVIINLVLCLAFFPSISRLKIKGFYE